MTETKLLDLSPVLVNSSGSLSVTGFESLDLAFARRGASLRRVSLLSSHQRWLQKEQRPCLGVLGRGTWSGIWWGLRARLLSEFSSLSSFAEPVCARKFPGESSLQL